MSEKNSHNEIKISGIQKIEQKLTEQDPKVFDGIPEPKRKRILEGFVLSMKSYSGPLPAPEILEKFNEIIPNGADRIMSIFEQQSAHRIETEKLVVSKQLSQSNTGQYLAFFIGLSTLVCTGFCAYIGSDILAGVIGVGGLTGLVTAFIKGKEQQVKDLEEKRPSPVLKKPTSNRRPA